LVGIFTIACIMTLQRTRWRSAAVLTAIVLTSAFLEWAGWAEVRLVRDLSPIPSGLPTPVLPLLDDVPATLGGALAVALLAALQTAALAENVREPNGSMSRLDRDFIGQGLANLVGSIFQCLPTSASLSRTAVNVRAGARTRLANLTAGVLMVAVLFSAGSLIERIALAALAGQLIVAAISLFDWKAIRLVWNIDVKSRTILVVTFVSTLVLPLEFSIYLGIGLSLLFYVFSSMSHLHMVRLVPTADGHFRAEAIPARLPNAELVILSVSGNLFHASMKRLEELLPSPDGTVCPIVILRVRDHENLGSTGVRVLLRYATRLKAQGGRLYLTGIHPHVKAELMRTGMFQKFGANCIFEETQTVFGATEQALSAARAWLAEHHTPPIRKSA
jgi:SulP family sulfate permease